MTEDTPFKNSKEWNDSQDQFTVLKSRRKGDRYKAGFWLLITFLIGFICGIVFADKVIIGLRLSEGVKLQGMVISGKVYDVKERP